MLIKTKMKSKLYKIASVILLLSIAACDVERIPETQISDASFWKSESDVRSAANYLYTFLPGFTRDEAWSDNAYGVQSDPISDGTRLAPATAADYSAPYQLIRAANNIIEKVPYASVEDNVKSRYIAEARFFRAYGYVQLVQKYGNVPLILKTLVQNSPELTQPSGNRAQIMAQIYQDLDFAFANLPTPKTRATEGYPIQLLLHLNPKLLFLKVRGHVITVMATRLLT
jgi:hypothetical protein